MHFVSYLSSLLLFSFIRLKMFWEDHLLGFAVFPPVPPKVPDLLPGLLGGVEDEDGPVVIRTKDHPAIGQRCAAAELIPVFDIAERNSL